MNQLQENMRLRSISPTYTSSYTTTAGTSTIYYGMTYDDWDEERIKEWSKHTLEWWNKETDLKKYDIDKMEVYKDRTQNHWVAFTPWAMEDEDGQKRH